MRLLLVFAISLIFFPTFVKAQDSAPAPDLLEQLETKTQKPAPAPLEPRVPDALLNKDKVRLPYKNYSEIPEEAIVEAEAFQKACVADVNLSTYYECDCWAMRFLEARLVRGPDIQQDIIMMDIGSECPNTAAIAGSAYKNCIAQGIDFFPKKQDPEEYCSCVGNSYAKLFERSGQSIDSKLMIQLRTMASLSCIQQPPGVPALVPPVK